MRTDEKSAAFREKKKEQWRRAEKLVKQEKENLCPYAKRCGGCDYQGVPYAEQLSEKEREIRKLLKPYGPVGKIIGMKDPLHYRHKVHAVFDYEKGKIISGVYREKTHEVVNIEACMIEQEIADEIIQTVKKLAGDFKIRTYDEDTGSGLLRHVLVRCGYRTGEILVVLVLASPILPAKKNFVRALMAEHPEITSVVLNINDRRTSMVLGARNITLYGNGYIEDEICGCRFRISPNSFYQVNPEQAEILYKTAIRMAKLTGREKVLDAYCGTGTIGICAARKAGQVIGVELNRDAVKDAVINVRQNHAENVTFAQGDAGEYIQSLAENGRSLDVVIMDPPRTGSTPEFLSAVLKMKPERVVYVSCGPDTLARDLKTLTDGGYRMEEAVPVDLFPFTKHVETVVCLSNKNAKPKDYVEIGLDAEDYYRIKDSII